MLFLRFSRVVFHVGIALCLLGQGLHVGGTGGDVVGDPQGRHHMDAPGCAEIAQRTELGACSWCLVTCHVFFLLIGFLMAPERAPPSELDLLGDRLLYGEAREAPGEWHGSDGSGGQCSMSCKKIPR